MTSGRLTLFPDLRLGLEPWSKSHTQDHDWPTELRTKGVKDSLTWSQYIRHFTRVDGNGEWIPPTPSTFPDQLVRYSRCLYSIIVIEPFKRIKEILPICTPIKKDWVSSHHAMTTLSWRRHTSHLGPCESMTWLQPTHKRVLTRLHLERLRKNVLHRQ